MPWIKKPISLVLAKISRFMNRYAYVGSAITYHESGAWYREAELPKQEASISVFITPGLRATTAIPSGNSFATDLVRPSIAHFDAQ